MKVKYMTVADAEPHLRLTEKKSSLLLFHIIVHEMVKWNTLSSLDSDWWQLNVDSENKRRSFSTTKLLLSISSNCLVLLLVTPELLYYCSLLQYCSTNYTRHHCPQDHWLSLLQKERSSFWFEGWWQAMQWETLNSSVLVAIVFPKQYDDEGTFWTED